MSLDSAYELDHRGRVFLIVERASGDVVGAFYPAAGAPPGWWDGHRFGRHRRLHLPDLDPLQIAARFMNR